VRENEQGILNARRHFRSSAVGDSPVLASSREFSRRVGQARASFSWACASGTVRELHHCANRTTPWRAKAHRRFGLLVPPYAA